VVKNFFQITKKYIFTLIILNFLAPGSGFPIRIRIHKVAESGSNPDPVPDPQPWKKSNRLIQCCASGMFYPESGSLNFSSRILGVKKHRIPDPTVNKKREEK
jgi:hypothetical protein